MDDDKILELTGKIEQTIGKDNAAMISDTLGEIITGNSLNRKEIESRDAEIKELKDRNEKLVSANGALLQKIPMGEEKRAKEEKQEAPATINLKDAFDENGNFRK